MSGEARPEAGEDSLLRETRLRSRRQRAAAEAGEPSLGRRLAQIGVLGWMIVTPTLLGVLLGRWLDRLLGAGLQWTGALLTIGLAFGSWSAWKWMNKP